MGDQLFFSFDDDPQTIEARFRRFHRDNPRVYTMLVALARRALGRGKARVGMKALWEVMRWEVWLETASEDEYKLNNDFSSRYARLIMQQEADLSGIFETRRLRAV